MDCYGRNNLVHGTYTHYGLRLKAVSSIVLTLLMLMLLADLSGRHT